MAFQKIFKRLAAKDFKEASTNDLYYDEIEQNRANEMLLQQELQEPLQDSPKHPSYIMTLETSMGFFYWECNLQWVPPPNFEDTLRKVLGTEDYIDYSLNSQVSTTIND